MTRHAEPEMTQNKHRQSSTHQSNIHDNELPMCQQWSYITSNLLCQSAYKLRRQSNESFQWPFTLFLSFSQIHTACLSSLFIHITERECNRKPSGIDYYKLVVCFRFLRLLDATTESIRSFIKIPTVDVHGRCAWNSGIATGAANRNGRFPHTFIHVIGMHGARAISDRGLPYDSPCEHPNASSE